jgi:RND family efflux transporter MFP subunit
MKKLLAIIIVLAVIAGIVGILLYNKSKREKKIQKTEILTSIPVTVGEVTKEKLEDKLALIGTVSPYNEVTVASETQGKIIGVYFNIGDKVSAEKVLVKVDDEIKEATLLNAEANFEKAKKDLERYEELFKEGSITEVQLEVARLTYKQTESQYIIASRQLRDTRIVAPFSGVITGKLIDLGTVVSNATPIATLVNIAIVKIKVNVPEKDVFKIKVGDVADISTEVYPEEKFSGKIININSKGDESHTFPVEIQLPNNNVNPLKAGMFVNVNFGTVEKGESIVIPRIALVGSVKNPQVYVIENNIARLRDIIAGISMGEKLEVLNGLSIGEVVVTNGQINLKDSVSVIVSK